MAAMLFTGAIKYNLKSVCLQEILSEIYRQFSTNLIQYKNGNSSKHCSLSPIPADAIGYFLAGKVFLGAAELAQASFVKSCPQLKQTLLPFANSSRRCRLLSSRQSNIAKNVTCLWMFSWALLNWHRPVL